jgi:hypothetical protein
MLAFCWILFALSVNRVCFCSVLLVEFDLDSVSVMIF